MLPYSKTINLMNTFINIKAYSLLPHIDLVNSVEEAFNAFYHVVARFTRFSDSSEVGILNRSGGKFTNVSEELFKLIEFGLKYGKETNGLFDITIIDLLEAYGYKKNPDFSELDDPHLGEKLKAIVSSRPGQDAIELDKANYRVKLLPGQRIDLGAYAKGYAIGLAAKILINLGINDFFINAGGDVYAHGYDRTTKAAVLWKAQIFDPDKSLETGKFEIHKELKLKNETVACSGPWARKIKFFHHLLNPYTGTPVENKKISYVRHADAMEADILATIKYLSYGNSPILLDSKI